MSAAPQFCTRMHIYHDLQYLIKYELSGIELDGKIDTSSKPNRATKHNSHETATAIGIPHLLASIR